MAEDAQHLGGALDSTHDGARLSRAERRRQAAQRLVEGRPQEGVAIFRSVERAVLVGLHREGQSRRAVESSLDELELLVDTAGAESAARVIQRRETPHVATFVGRGKIDDLRDLLREVEADAVVFDDELTPAQQRNLEERLSAKVLDRTIVILDIFAQHASSREGRTQVELAQLTYLLPRLRGWGQTLSRQAGRIGTRGPGEMQLEVDRRKLNRRITKLRRDLADLERTRRRKRRNRERHDVPVVALVGYTNAGKSTLLNRATGAEAHVADQLFATLDPTARRLQLPDGRTAVMTDTVGFVRKLPTQLVEAFKSTLEETLRADVLLHVVDASHPQAEAHAHAVDSVLEEIGAEEMPRLVVLNKADATAPAELERLARVLTPAVVVSAATGEGVPELVQQVASMLPPDRRMVEVVVPYEHAELVALAHRKGEVLREEHRPEGTYLLANVAPAAGSVLQPYTTGAATSDGDGQPPT